MTDDHLIIGVLDTSRQFEDSAVAAKCRDYTISCCRFDYFGPLIESDCVDDLLERACQSGRQYCLVQSYGHVMFRYRSGGSSINTNFLKTLMPWVSRHDFFVAGRVVEEPHRWYGLEETCFLVNLQHYLALGKPKYARTANRGVIVPATERTIKPTSQRPVLGALHGAKGSVTMQPSLPGWNWFAEGLKAGIPIYDFEPSLRQCSSDVRPKSPQDLETFRRYAGEGIFEYEGDGQSPGLSDDWRRFLDFVKDQARYAKQGVFLTNYENYQGLEHVAREFGGPVSTFYGVAAGFKPNRILETHGFGRQTKVVFFDYSKIALDIKRTLHAEWDGAGYPDFIQRVAKRFPDAFYQLWSKPGGLDMDLVLTIWENEMDVWGGEANFRRHWSEYRRLPHRFIHCDLFIDPQPLLAAVRAEPAAVMWWSNVFHSLNGVWFYEREQRKRIYQCWLKSLARINPELLIYGADVHNLPINGEKIRQLADEHRQAAQDSPS